MPKNEIDVMKHFVFVPTNYFLPQSAKFCIVRFLSQQIFGNFFHLKSFFPLRPQKLKYVSAAASLTKPMYRNYVTNSFFFAHFIYSVNIFTTGNHTVNAQAESIY